MDFISSAWVEQAIVFACRDLGHVAQELPVEMHGELVQQVMLRARTFVEPGRVTDMMLEVAGIFEEETESLAERTVPPLSQPPGAERGSLRVLVVDDDAISRRVIAAMLQADGAEVLTVESGEAAVESATRGEFDVICMDCFMPGVSGFQATQQIRDAEAKSGRPRVAIVAITGQDAKSTRDHAMRVGVDELLVKPVTRAVLTAAVKGHAARQTAKT